MYAGYLAIDDIRNAPPSVDPLAGITLHPTVEEMENAVRSLDGDKIRMVIVSQRAPNENDYFPFGGNGMMIGGEANGLLVCKLGVEETDMTWYLTDPTKDHCQTERVNFCCYPEDYSSDVCVKLNEVLLAVRHFAETGERSPDLHWTESME